MPTSYTEQIYEGKPVTLKDFVLRCARAFGYLVEMRDESLNAELPDVIEPSRYHEKELVKAREELARLQRLTVEDAQPLAQAEYEKSLQAHEQFMADRRAMRARYDAMIANVNDWVPPTKDHVALKDFMLTQLKESREFDCGSTSYFKSPLPVSAADWLQKKIQRAADDVVYHRSEWAKDVERAEEATDWITALRNSFR